MGYIGTREYTASVILTKQQAIDAVSAQNSILQDGIKIPDDNKLLSTLLGVGGTLIGLVFRLPNAVTLAASLVGALGLSLDNFKNTVIAVGQQGLNSLVSIQQFMINNTQYDRVEVTFPFLEFKYDDSSQNWRIVQGAGIVTRVHSGSGWIIM